MSTSIGHEFDRAVTPAEIKAYAQGLRDMEQAVKRMIGMERFVKATHPEHADAALSSVVQALIERTPDVEPSETPEDAARATEVLLEGLGSAEEEIERLRATVEAKQESISFWMTTPCSADHFDVRLKTLEDQLELLNRSARQAQQVRQPGVDRALTKLAQQTRKQIESEKEAYLQARVTETEKALADPDKVNPTLRGGRLANMRVQELISKALENRPGRRARKVLWAIWEDLDQHNEQMLQTMRDQAEYQHDMAVERLTRVNQS